jgi:hypothetical protein
MSTQIKTTIGAGNEDTLSAKDITQLYSDANKSNISYVNGLILANAAIKEIKDTADDNGLVNLTEEKLDEVLAKLKQDALNRVGVGLRYPKGTKSVSVTKEIERDDFKAIVPCALTIKDIKIDYDIDAHGAIKLLTVIGAYQNVDEWRLDGVDAYQLDSNKRRVIAYFADGSKVDTNKEGVYVVPPEVRVTTSAGNRVSAKEFFKDKLAGAVKSSTKSLVDQMIASDKTNNFTNKD